MGPQAHLIVVPPYAHNEPLAEQPLESDPARGEQSSEEERLPTWVSEEAWKTSIFHGHSVIDEDGAREMCNYQGRKKLGIGDEQPVMLNARDDGKTMLSHRSRKQETIEQMPIGSSPAAPKEPHDAAKAAASLVLRYGERYQHHADPRVAAAAAFLVNEAKTVLSSQGTPNVHLVGSQDMIDAFEIIALRGPPQADQPARA